MRSRINGCVGRVVVFCVVLAVFFCAELFAEESNEPGRANDVQSVKMPRRGPRSWWAMYGGQDEQWYKSAEGIRIADNILSWQSAQGSWPKNMDTTAMRYKADPNSLKGTFDNRATVNEIRFLSRSFRATGDERYRAAVIKAIDHILKAQYPTGGWPQFYPLDKQYHRYITFNDDCMVGLMRLMREVATSGNYDFIDAQRRKAAQDSFDRGIECILKCQVIVNGKPTVWCQQYDEVDYSPRQGRSFEPVALSALESVGVLELLMSLKNPSDEVVAAIEGATEWFDSAKISGIRVVWTRGDRVVEQDPNAPAIWARFYEIGSNRPIFEGRDGVIKYSMAEIEQERRAGYGWYGNWAENVAEDYARWKKKWGGTGILPRQGAVH